MSTVDIKSTSPHELAIEWVGSVTNDMIADSVLALLIGIDSSPATVKSEFWFLLLILRDWGERKFVGMSLWRLIVSCPSCL